MLPPEKLAGFRRTCLEFGLNYQWLRNVSRANNHPVALVRTKVHKMQHLPKFAQLINPIHVQCYGEESLIGTTAKVWRASMRNKYKDHAQRTVLIKRTTGVLLRFEA